MNGINQNRLRGNANFSGLNFNQCPLYDTAHQTAGALAKNIPFFTSRTRGTNGPEVTNMNQTNSLPIGEVYQVQGIGLEMIQWDYTEITAVDIKSLFRYYVLNFALNGIEILTLPLAMIPAGGGAAIMQSTGNTKDVSYYANGAPTQQACFYLAPDNWIEIQGGQNFSANLMSLTGYTIVDDWTFRVILMGNWGKLQ